MPSVESFRTVRWIRTVNLILQALLVVTLFLGLNHLAQRHPLRGDLIAHRRYALSPETLSYLHQLAKPVRVVVTFNENSENQNLADSAHDVSGLLSEYRDATATNETGKISIEQLDIYRQRRDAEQLGIEKEGEILVICGDRTRTLQLTDLYEVKKNHRSAFRGEQAFTAAILDVSRASRDKIYFLSGHGEQMPEDVDPTRGLSLLGEDLRRRNFDFDLLDLSLSKSIPEDAALLIAAGPQGPFDRFEEELLRQYLAARAGRLILMLDPGRSSGLDSLLADWGIVADDDVVCDTGAKNVTDDGDLLIWAFPPHPVTQILLNNNLHLRLGLARSVRADTSHALDESLKVTILAATSPTAWGNRNYRALGVPRYTPGIDLKGGPETKHGLGVVTASERVKARVNGEDLNLSVKGGQLIVCGTSKLATNNRYGDFGNQNFILAAINWATDRDTQLAIPARPIERYELSLSEFSLAKLRLVLLFLPPAAAALLGLFVYWARRR